MAAAKSKQPNRRYTLIIEQDSAGWFVGEVAELPGCRTQAKTQAALVERTKEAIRAHLTARKDPHSKTFIGVRRIEV